MNENDKNDKIESLELLDDDDEYFLENNDSAEDGNEFDVNKTLEKIVVESNSKFKCEYCPKVYIGITGPKNLREHTKKCKKLHRFVNDCTTCALCGKFCSIQIFAHLESEHSSEIGNQADDSDKTETPPDSDFQDDYDQFLESDHIVESDDDTLAGK